MKYFLLLIFVYLAIATSYNFAQREEFAKQLLASKAYPRIKDLETALRFIDLLIVAFENINATQYELAVDPFPCPPTGRTVPRPTDAKRLLPGDIDLVMGIGDSLTAAFGADATSLINLFTDYRGSSFSVGGTRTVDEVSTIVNILKVYNSNLQGFSTGSGNQNSANAKLNVAVSGATSYDLLPQVDALGEKLLTYDRNGWKLLSVFIGGNDLCDSCEDSVRFSAKNFRQNVEVALDKLKERVTNLFVNLILPPDVTLLSGITGGICGILHPFECGCNTDPQTSQLHKEYVAELIDLAGQSKYKNSLNFYLVIQPFLEYIHLPLGPDGTPDKSYFAPDCFHFSTKSHAAAGLALWNNMMENNSEKKRAWVIGEPFECPAPGQFIQ